MGMDLCPLYTGAWVNVETAHGNGGEQDDMRYYLRSLFAQMFIAVEKCWPQLFSSEYRIVDVGLH